jgi:hypothetical protein
LANKFKRLFCCDVETSVYGRFLFIVGVISSLASIKQGMLKPNNKIPEIFKLAFIPII